MIRSFDCLLQLNDALDHSIFISLQKWGGWAKNKNKEHHWGRPGGTIIKMIDRKERRKPGGSGEDKKNIRAKIGERTESVYRVR
jgi:hypothetical protein